MRLRGWLFVLFIILTVVAGCAAEAEEQRDRETGMDEDAISVYLLSNSDMTEESIISGTVQRMVQQYNRERNCDKVIIKYIATEELFRSCMTEEILSGMGPDVIILNERFFDCYTILGEAGLLEDLYPYINGYMQGPPLDSGGFIPDLINRYKVTNQLVGLPLTMRVEGFIVSGVALEASGLSMHNRLMDELELLQLLQDFGNRTQACSAFFETGAGAGAFSVLAGTRWFNPASGTVDFNSPSFRTFTEKYLELLRAFPEFACNDFKDLYDLPEKVFYEGAVLLRAKPLNLTTFAPSAISFCVAEAKDGGMTVFPDSWLAINRNSASKELAYDFVRYCLTDGQRLIETRVPANMNEIHNAIEIRTLGAAMVDAEIRFVEALLKTKTVCIHDEKIQIWMEEMIADIVQNGISADEAIKKLQSKTAMYYNE